MFDPSRDWPHRSEAGLSVWLDQEERERRGRALEARVERRTLPVDGVNREWTVAMVGQSWSSVHRADRITIIVSGRGVSIEGLELETVPEPASVSPPELPQAWR